MSTVRGHMPKTARDRLARLFDEVEPAGSFSAQLLAPAHLLELEVSRVGPVRLPVRAPLARKLIAVARPAMFGRGAETLTDTGVRDTWELTPDQFTLGGPGWTALLDGVLEHFRDELGLPRSARLRVEPHAMLVYGKGQFFLPHQDSEKHDAMALGWWTSPDGAGGEPISLSVPDSEVCATTPSKALEPYESEYEGYTGNYGNTVDRWYRRAAVVVWPRDRAFAARAGAGSQWALRELRHRIDAGDLTGARAAAESLAPFWNRTASQPGLLDAALDVAAGLSAAGTAAMLLEPFRVETLTSEHANGLAAVAGRYGRTWIRDVINGWFERERHRGTDRHEWVGYCPGCARRCTLPEDRRWCGCWQPEPGSGWMTSCEPGPRPRAPRSADRSWRSSAHR